jgi:hypothetical protein
MFEVVLLDRVLDRDDETELMSIAIGSLEEGSAIH